jgi:hypothetical protein
MVSKPRDQASEHFHLQIYEVRSQVSQGQEVDMVMQAILLQLIAF